MLELHTYTLGDVETLRRYTTHFWPRHISSLRKYGITIHGVWINTSADGHQVIALVGYPPGSDPARLAENYRASADFGKDHADFDVSLLTSTQTATLEALPRSPLK